MTTQTSCFHEQDDVSLEAASRLLVGGEYCTVDTPAHIITHAFLLGQQLRHGLLYKKHNNRTMTLFQDTTHT